MRDPRRLTMLARVAWGVAMVAAPNVANRAFGAPQDPYLTRAFAVREAMLGLGYLSATSEAERGRWFGAGVAADVADGVAAAIAGKRGELSPGAARSFVAVSAASTLLNSALLLVARRGRADR